VHFLLHVVEVLVAAARGELAAEVVSQLGPQLIFSIFSPVMAEMGVRSRRLGQRRLLQVLVVVGEGS